jgi:hypothetical protein
MAANHLETTLAKHSDQLAAVTAQRDELRTVGEGVINLIDRPDVQSLAFGLVADVFSSQLRAALAMIDGSGT